MSDLVLVIVAFSALALYIVTTDRAERRQRSRIDFWRQLAVERQSRIIDLLDERDAALAHADDAQAVVDALLDADDARPLRETNVRVIRGIQ